MATKLPKKPLEDLVQEFIEVWDAYWEAGPMDGPTFKELEAKLKKVRKRLEE